jgi:hypothetical protein
MNRKLLLVAFGTIALIAAGAIFFLSPRGPAGADSPESAVTEYVSALQEHDPGRLAEIADPDHDATREIPARMRHFGSDELAVASTSISGTESDATKRADLAGTVNGASFTDQLWLYRRDDRWYVALGPNRNAHPKGT